MRRVLRRSTLIPTIVAIITLWGCATVPMAPEDMDRESKRFTPPAGKAVVYLVRQPRLQASALAFNVSVDGTIVARIVTGSFVALVLEPGRHVLRVDGLGADHVNLLAAPGRAYFFEVVVRPMPGIAIDRLGESEGRALVLNSRQASNLPE